MSITANGILIPEDSGIIKVDSTNIETIDVDARIAWKKQTKTPTVTYNGSQLSGKLTDYKRIDVRYGSGISGTSWYFRGFIGEVNSYVHASGTGTLQFTIPIALKAGDKVTFSVGVTWNEASSVNDNPIATIGTFTSTFNRNNPTTTGTITYTATAGQRVYNIPIKIDLQAAGLDEEHEAIADATWYVYSAKIN